MASCIAWLTQKSKPIFVGCLVASWVLGQTVTPQVLGIQKLPIMYFVLVFVPLFCTLPSIKTNPFVPFLLFTTISYFLYPHQSWLSFLYLVRLVCSLLLIHLFTASKHQKMLFGSFFALFLASWLQYFLFPDFRYFQYGGWDPHLNRIVGPLLDPTFTGFVLVAFTAFFYFHHLVTKNTWCLVLFYLSFLTLSFTYSRSSLLAFLVVGIVLGRLQKNNRIFYLFFTLTLAAFLFLPHSFGEGTYLARSSSIKAKIVNYQQAVTFIAKHPLGVGYNNLGYYRPPLDPSTPSHSQSGFDSSLLTILATTGPVGFGLFIFGLYLWAKKLYTHTNYLAFSLLVALLFHSLFANSLVYPFTFMVIPLVSTFGSTKEG